MERGWTSVRLIAIFLVNDSFFLFFLFSWVFLLGFFLFLQASMAPFKIRGGWNLIFFCWCRLYMLLDLLILLKNKKERDDKSDIESRLLIFMID